MHVTVLKVSRKLLCSIVLIASSPKGVLELILLLCLPTVVVSITLPLQDKDLSVLVKVFK